MCVCVWPRTYLSWCFGPDKTPSSCHPNLGIGLYLPPSRAQGKFLTAGTGTLSLGPFRRRRRRLSALQVQHTVKGKPRVEEGEKINDDISPCDLAPTRNRPDACSWPSLSVNSAACNDRRKGRRRRRSRSRRRRRRKLRSAEDTSLT